MELFFLHHLTFLIEEQFCGLCCNVNHYNLSRDAYTLWIVFKLAYICMATPKMLLMWLRHHVHFFEILSCLSSDLNHQCCR